MLAAGLNANLGGRNQIPLEVERQVVLWMCELFHFPTQSAGVLTTGTSAATIIALSTARHTYLSKHGQQQADRLCVYASSESHGCIWRALRIMGFAKDCLRLIPCLDNHSINIALLEQRIIDDQNNGMVAWLIVGNAGTVNTGAIDDLQSLASLAANVGAWLHIDGALGALAMLSPQLAVAFKGIEQADSIAMDFHKWGQVPYDAGFVLMRDGEAHRQNFDASDAYLQRDEQGLAANSPWPCDQGIDLSRGFRALKVWFTLKSFGTKQMAAMMEHSCALAQELAELIQVNPVLVLMADVPLNIVCFRYCGDKSLSDSAYDTINRAMVVHIQCSGLAAPSLTVLHGRAVIRVAIVNHRTQSSDIGKLLASTMDAVEACCS